MEIKNNDDWLREEIKEGPLKGFGVVKFDDIMTEEEKKENESDQ